MNNKGFTLIEVLLLIFILGLLSTVIIPNINLIKKINEEIFLNTMIRDIETFRNKALIEKKSYVFNLDLKRNDYYFTTNLQGHISIIKRKKLPDGLFLESNNFDSHIIFNSLGRPHKAGTFHIKTSDDLIKIKITPVTGQINQERSSNKYE